MRLAISNIAWRPEARAAAHALLADLDVRGLEIAPGLAFPNEPDPMTPSDAMIAEWRADLDRHGLTAVSMQSLLFGVRDAQLFGAPHERRAFEEGVGATIDLARRIGCPNLVLGSPGARSVPADLGRSEAERSATALLRRLGDRAMAAGTVVALEPNPAAYGTNFLNTLAATVSFARQVDHQAIRVNFDIGALIMNDEVDDALGALPRFIDLISHVHVSEPNLAPAPGDPQVLTPILLALLNAGYRGAVSIEMRSAANDDLDQVRASVTAVQGVLADIIKRRGS